MAKIERQSNVEFIRILAMVFIVVGHVILHGTHDSLPGSEWVKAVTVTGVNLFVLISGYWGIRLNVKSFLNIIGIVVFYAALGLLAYCTFFKQPVLKSQITSILLPLSKYGSYWFVSCYLMLMLFSPALNVVLKRASNHWYIGALSVLVYVSCVSGWWFQNPINIHGYTVFNMIFIYFLGHGIRRFDLSVKLRPYSWICLYVMFTSFVLLMSFMAKGRFLMYNNPFVVLAAVSLFCLILNAKFQSTVINGFAKCMFPVYLIQEGAFGKKIYEILYEYGVSRSFISGGYLSVLCLYIVALFAAALTIEPIRKRVMTKPVALLSDMVSEKLHGLARAIDDKINSGR